MQKTHEACRLRKMALLITSVYAVLAAAWMLGTFLTNVTATREEMIQARIIKDSLFIVISGLALYAMIHRAVRKLDNSERALKAERALRESNDHLRSVVYNSPVAIVSLDPQGCVTTWNRAAEELFGWTEVEVHGTSDPSVPPDKLEEAKLHRQRVLRGERLQDVEVRRLRKDGRPLEISLSAAPLLGRDEQVASIILFCADITERKQQAEKVQHLATHDPLTGLPNRRILEDHLKRMVERAGRGNSAALLMLDLDSFKMINDELGHLMGDQFLVQIARVLERALRGGDVLTRFGGDEFALLLDDVTPAAAKAAAERIRLAVASHPFVHGDKSYDTSVSIGMAMISAESGDQGVMMMADTALMMAKEEGKNRAVVYEPGNQTFSRLGECSRWATKVKEALRDNRFLLYFQAVVDLRTNSAHHHEVLIRMRDRDGTIIAPGAFMPAAEQFGLMPRIDRWVIEKAIDLLVSRPELALFVNLSGSSLADHGLLAYIEDRVRTVMLEPGRLTFEITETAAVTDLHHAQQWMMRLSNLGCQFALDDFGVAFSSFAYLRELPVKYVKLDGSFIRHLLDNPADRAMVQALNTVAHSLGKVVVAEWVENQGVAAALLELGTEFGQGYFWGAPKPEPMPLKALSVAA